jgi:hypothetical protein
MTLNPNNDFKYLDKQMANLSELACPTIPVSKMPPNALIESGKANQASEYHKALVSRINNFDKSLDEDHEVGVRLVSFGSDVTFHLTALGYQNPLLITFFGTTSDGNPIELLQHVSQISILLMKLPRLNPNQPKKTIGFLRS